MKRNFFILIGFAFTFFNFVSAQNFDCKYKYSSRKDSNFMFEFIENENLIVLNSQIYDDFLECKGNNKKNIPGSFTIEFNQDVLTLNKKLNEDRDYTMGMTLKWQGAKTNNSLLVLPFIHYYVDKLPNIVKSSKDAKSKLVDHKFSLGFSGFTPYNIGDSLPISNDRPYAALLFFESTKVYQRKRTLMSTSFSVGWFGGVLGKSVAKGLQSGIHTWQRVTKTDPSNVRPNPLGWHNQVSNSGKPFFQYDYIQLCKLEKNISLKNETRRNHPENNVCNLQFQFSPFYGAGIGMIYNYISSGFLFKMGKFSKDYFTIPDNSYGYDLVGNTPVINNKPSCNIKHTELYLFSNADFRYWFYNATLEGLPFLNNRDKVKISRYDILPTGHFELGICLGVNNTFFSFSQIFRTRETKVVDRNHYWGKIAITFKR